MSEFNENYINVDKVILSKLGSNYKVIYDVLELRYDKGMCSVSAMDDPKGCKMEPSMVKLSKIMDWGKCQCNALSDDYEIEYSIKLTIWIIVDNMDY